MKHKQAPSQDRSDDALDRAAIDGRAAFAACAVIASLAILALLDRIGAPERLIAALGPALALAGLATIGFLLRSMRIFGFHAAARATPGVYAGLAMTALGAGIALPFAPPLPGDASLSSLLSGFGVGMALVGLVSGPLLRKSGAFSVADLIATRFASLTLSVGVTCAIAAIGFCLGLAGLSLAQEALRMTTLGAQASLIVATVAVGLIVTPGGMAGLIWSGAGAAGLVIAALTAPLALMTASGAAMPLPFAAEGAFDQALARLNGASEAGSGVDALLVCALALGLGALPPLLAPLTTTRRRDEARSGGMVGVAWSALLALMALVSLAAATLALRPPATPTSIPLLLWSLPDLQGFGAAFASLATAGRMAVALAMSAAGFMTFATAFGDRTLYQPQKTHALASRRLALTRVVLIGAIAGAAWLQLNLKTDPHLLIGAAIGLSAVAVAPMLALALWPRANGQDAAFALVAGLAMAEAVVLMSGGSPTTETLAGAAVTGFAAALAAGVGASLRHPTGPVTDGDAFVHGLLHGPVDVLRPDKDA